MNALCIKSVRQFIEPFLLIVLNVSYCACEEPFIVLSTTVLWSNRHLGPVSERRLSENSEYVNPEMRETLGFPFQNGRFVKPEKAG